MRDKRIIMLKYFIFHKQNFPLGNPYLERADIMASQEKVENHFKRCI
jgi:hypothetical protein